MSELEDLRQELQYNIIQKVQMGTYNTFAGFVEFACGKEKADEFRKLAIKEGKWIEMDGKVFNSTCIAMEFK